MRGFTVGAAAVKGDASESAVAFFTLASVTLQTDVKSLAGVRDEYLKPRYICKWNGGPRGRRAFKRSGGARNVPPEVHRMYYISRREIYTRAFTRITVKKYDMRIRFLYNQKIYSQIGKFMFSSKNIPVKIFVLNI